MRSSWVECNVGKLRKGHQAENSMARVAFPSGK